MIATIKAEWRKNRFRPAFLITAGLVAAVAVLVYGVNWYEALQPASGDRPPLPIATLYPDQFVNAVIGAGFPLGAAMAIVLGALYAGSEFGWGTLKTLFTQRPGRLALWTGRVVVFMAWMGLLTATLFAVGAGSSVVVASFQHHAIAWPHPIDVLKGFGSIWLIFVANGAIGMALGVLVRQPAAALGIGLIYVLAIEVVAVRFIDGIDNGAYKWVANLLVNQNATALTQSFKAAAAPSISAEHAVLVLFAYAAALLTLAGAALRLRDVT